MKSTYTYLEREEKEHFDKMAKVYDKNYGYNQIFTKHKIHRKADYFLTLLKKYDLNSKKVNILEIGCGTGAYTALVARKLKGRKITAIDISPGIIKVAKNKTKNLKNISYKVKSAYDTGLKNDSIDVIFGFYVLHHLVIEKAVKEINRILKPGGLVFFCEPNILNPLVYIIKSNKYLKERAGDSLDEWAINPLGIKKYFPGYKVLDVVTSEYIIPISFLPYRLILKIDNIAQYFRYIPVLKNLGGSVKLLVKKKI